MAFTSLPSIEILPTRKNRRLTAAAENDNILDNSYDGERKLCLAKRAGVWCEPVSSRTFTHPRAAGVEPCRIPALGDLSGP